MINDFKSKALKCYELVVIIQERWKQINMIRHIQKELVTRMWEKEIEIIEQYCVKYKAKNKKIKLLYHKIQNIDDDIKDKILSNYMELRRCMH